MIVLINEVIKLRLLLQEVVFRWFSGFFLQRQVHAFVTTSLFWVTRCDPFDVKAEPEPSYCYNEALDAFSNKPIEQIDAGQVCVSDECQ